MGRSKKVDTHTWVHEGNKRTVQIRMRNHNDRAKKTRFFACEILEDGDEGDEIASATDVNELLDQVDDHFRAQYETDWELAMFVGASSTSSGRGAATRGVKLGVEFVAVGETADGSPVWTKKVRMRELGRDPDRGLLEREGDDHKTWDGWWGLKTRGSARSGEPSSNLGGFHGSIEDPVLIPATPERVNAAYRAMNVIEELGDELGELFGEGRAEETLEAIAAGEDALPAPGGA